VRPGREHDGGCPVRDLRRIAGRDRPALCERRTQLAEGLDRGVRPHPLVRRDDERVALALGDLDRDDLGVEDARLDRRSRALMRAGGDSILQLAGDLEPAVVPLG
jgi:hypothetical protein